MNGPFHGQKPLLRLHMAPAPRSMEPPCVAPGRDAADLSGLPPAVVETIIHVRAPSTRQTYALKWSLFANWCSSRREDPRRCTIGVVLSFLQERLERRLSPSTLKVYVAAIAAHHDAVDGRFLGKHDLIVRFLKGARRMKEEADPALALLCPVRALRIYVDCTRSVRSSEQLFVCHGGQQKGKAVSKQRLAHWIVEAVALAYQSQGELCPLGVRAHSTRSVASSHALAHGASLADICRVASWATPNTFARFYNLLEPVSSRVLGK